MFELCLESGNHVRYYSIVPTEESGWEVRLEEDRKLRRRDRYRDWHRVERALAMFEREVQMLTAQGWRIAGEEASR